MTPRIPTSFYLAVCLVSLVFVDPAHGKRRRAKAKKSTQMYVMLDGSRTRVVWNDGDSFRIIRGPKKDVRARLADYNTLESYGPVHFWGGFHGYDLYDIAKKGTKLAKGSVWDCRTTGKGGGYGREVVHCPDLSREIIRKGYAHLFGVEDKPDPVLLKLQIQAQNERLGIWARGIPSHIVTSIHSISEKKRDGSERKEAYNRICDTRTGMSRVVKHKINFKTCDAWCYGGSCMVYAPFKVRYGKDRPRCLRKGRSNRLVVHPKLGYPMKGRF
jgi:micrococcal nuclease